MPPLLQAALGSILRHFLTLAAGALVTKGIWTQDEAAMYVTGFVVFLLTVIWSVWQKYRQRIKFLIGLYSRPGTTEEHVDELVRNVGTVRT